MKKIIYLWCVLFLTSLSCHNEPVGGLEQIIEDAQEEIVPETQEEEEEEEEEETTNENEVTNSETKKTLKILSLGDSYTIGESVCQTCRFPEQLKSNLIEKFEGDTEFELQVIAQTGWTTSALISAIEEKSPSDDFDLVTLLIGVNNQFQRRSFSIYEDEFLKLINTAISKAKDKKENLIVISIPDYAFTPFGKGNTSISEGIDEYNDFAQKYCETNDISYVYITDITRDGLTNTALVASDGLHPSNLAYSKFVERLLPLALEKLQD